MHWQAWWDDLTKWAQGDSGHAVGALLLIVMTWLVRNIPIRTGMSALQAEVSQLRADLAMVRVERLAYQETIQQQIEQHQATTTAQLNLIIGRLPKPRVGDSGRQGGD